MTETQNTPSPSKAEPPAKPAAEADGKKKSGRSPFAWFVAGIMLSGAAALGLVLWNAWSEPRYLLSPPLDKFVSEFGGNLLAAALIAFGLAWGGILRRRWAWIVPGGFVCVGAVIAVASTLFLGVGGLACGKLQFEAASPDRRLLVVAMRGNCGVVAAHSYTVVVRELGPSFPRQTTIFKSLDRPIPVEVNFSTGRTLTLLTAKANDKPPARYTVTIDRKSLRPDKVWRF